MKSVVVVLSLALATAACVSETEADVAASYDAIEAYAKAPKVAARLTQTNLVSDTPGAVTVDPNLVNPWGIAFNPAGPAWVSNAGSGTSTVYDAPGVLELTVQVGRPTGQIFNRDATAFGGDELVFATLDGTIAGWQPGAGVQLRVTTKGASYTGLARLGSRLFAADFTNGRIDAFDATFQPASVEGGFVDPMLPSSYAPFNVQELGGKLYVAYGTTDELGGGIVDSFDGDGRFLARVAQGGSLDAPWGLALAPASWGRLGGALLVGNFGSGEIHAFDRKTGSELGALADASGQPIVLENLWAIAFGPAGSGRGQLHFTAGVGGEAHGLYGRFDLLH